MATRWQHCATVCEPTRTLAADKRVRHLFYKGVDHAAFHIMDRALRYGDGGEIAGQGMKDLTEAYTTIWYQRHGAFQTLYCDGEAGLNCDEAKKYLTSLGTTLKTKAPGQHAHYIEARNGILRHTMHLIETDLK